MKIIFGIGREFGYMVYKTLPGYPRDRSQLWGNLSREELDKVDKTMKSMFKSCWSSYYNESTIEGTNYSSSVYYTFKDKADEAAFLLWSNDGVEV